MTFDWNIVAFSLCGGLFIVLGTVISLCLKTISKRILAVILGFAAGIMLSMTTSDLLPVALEYGSVYFCALGIIIGVGFMLVIDKFFFTVDRFKGSDTENNYMKIGLFIAASVAMHNLPEGIALGAGFEVAHEIGFAMALAIALHNVPEGIGIGAPLKLAKMKSIYILLVALVVALFTLVGTLISFLFVDMTGNTLSVFMGFSAGSMLYIISDELIPEGHKNNPFFANIGFFLGFLLMFAIH